MQQVGRAKDQQGGGGEVAELEQRRRRERPGKAGMPQFVHVERQCATPGGLGQAASGFAGGQSDRRGGEDAGDEGEQDRVPDSDDGDQSGGGQWADDRADVVAGAFQTERPPVGLLRCQGGEHRVAGR